MNSLIKNWYNISALLSGILVLALCLGDWDAQQKLTLGGTAIILLHFFEEFAFPGGFPWVGLHVEKGTDNTDAQSWELNNLNSLFGNWWYAVVVYLAAFFLPDISFLTLAVAIFAFVEVVMHLFIFNGALRTWYNPGLLTALFGLMPLSIWYFAQINAAITFTPIDIVLAIAWIALNYWIAFRSPLYKWMGKKSNLYGFSEEEVMRSARYIQLVHNRKEGKTNKAKDMK